MNDWPVFGWIAFGFGAGIVSTLVVWNMIRELKNPSIGLTVGTEGTGYSGECVTLGAPPPTETKDTPEQEAQP